MAGYGRIESMQDLVTGETVSYQYDVYNRLTGVSMPRNGVTQTRTFEYDGTTQRLWRVTQPENGQTTYAYNTDGTLWKRTDAKGQEIRYTYRRLATGDFGHGRNGVGKRVLL